MDKVCANKAPGEFLFPDCAGWLLSPKTGVARKYVKARKALEWLQVCLETLKVFDNSVKDPSRYTLKTYRAGRATQMASQGYTLGQIQLAGEWTSKSAPFCYMNTDIADKAQELNRMVLSEMEVGFLDDDGPEEPEDDEAHEFRTAPAGKAVETRPVEGVRPPPGLVLQEQVAEPLTHVEVALSNGGTDLVVVEEPKRKKRLKVVRHKKTAMGGDQ